MDEKEMGFIPKIVDESEIQRLMQEVQQNWQASMVTGNRGIIFHTSTILELCLIEGANRLRNLPEFEGCEFLFVQKGQVPDTCALMISQDPIPEALKRG